MLTTPATKIPAALILARITDQGLQLPKAGVEDAAQ